LAGVTVVATLLGGVLTGTLNLGGAGETGLVVNLLGNLSEPLRLLSAPVAQLLDLALPVRQAGVAGGIKALGVAALALISIISGQFVEPHSVMAIGVPLGILFGGLGTPIKEVSVVTYEDLYCMGCLK
jgi:hypothetical protein